MRLVSAIRRNSSLIAKISRLAIYIALISCLGYQIYQLRENLRIFSRDSLVQSPEIPFPGVTFCPPFVTAKKTYDPEYLRQINLTEDAFNIALQPTCPNPNLKIKNNEVVDFVEVLMKISPDFEESIHQCGIGDYSMFFQDCEKLLVKSVTDYGICYTFNMLGHDSIFSQNISSDFDTFRRTKITTRWNTDAVANESRHGDDKEPSTWSLDTGYTSDHEDLQPAKASKMKTFMLTTKSASDMSLCVERDQSYKMILHLPNELPQFSYETINVPLGMEASVMITAEVTSAEESLLNLEPESRGCYFDGEKPLKFFKSYTKANCEYECMTNLAYLSCGCVKFSMPRTKDMRVCDVNKHPCASYNAEFFLRSYYENRENRKEFPNFPCGCLPSCSNIRYKVIKTELKESKDGKEHSFSTMKVTFTESQVKKTSHFVIYKIERFIIDVGSSVGIFLGAALLIEIILYICKMIKKHGQKLIEMYRTRGQVTAESANANRSTSFGEVEVITMPEIRISNDQGEDLEIVDLE